MYRGKVSIKGTDKLSKEQKKLYLTDDVASACFLFDESPESIQLISALSVCGSGFLNYHIFCSQKQAPKTESKPNLSQNNVSQNNLS